MAGLLDGLLKGQWTEDPEKNQAITQGLLNAGLQLMQTRGRFGPGLGQAGLAGLQGFAQQQYAQHQQKLQKAQLEDLQRKKVLEGRDDERYQRENYLANLPSQYIKPPTQGNNPSAYTPGSQDLAGLAKAYLAAPGGLQTGMALQGALKPEKPTISKAGDVARDAKGNVVWQNPVEEDYNKLVIKGPDGRPMVNPLALDAKRQIAAAGKPETNIKIDNKLGEGLAKEVGPMIADSAQQASGAIQQIQNADTLIKAVDSNKVLAGPGATLRLKGAQLGQLFGVGGKDAQEQIANTRAVIQGLARATVSARAALKGQGQVSDFEGKLLAKAESGDIEDLTASEIKQIAVVNKRLAGQLVERHKALLKKAKGNQATAGVADFFEVEQPSQTLDWGALPSGR